MRVYLLSLCLIFSANIKADFNSALEQYSAANYSQAYDEFLSMAKIGEKRSQFNLAVMYYNGQHVKQDINMAYAWMKLATQGDSANKTELDAFEAVSKKVVDIKAAEKHFQQLDQQYSSQSLLASLYPVLVKPEGKSVFSAKPVKIKPPKYPRKAANGNLTGWVRFQFDIDTLGVPRNIQLIESFPIGIFDREALRAVSKWLFEPAINEQGERITQEDVGYTIEFKLKGFGEHSIKDNIYADNLAKAKQGDARAQFNIGFWDKMFTNRSNKNPNEWFMKAAVQDHPLAQYELGKSLLKGQGCIQDKTKGIEWLSRSAASGQSDAKQLLAALAVKSDNKESQIQAVEFLQDINDMKPAVQLNYAWMLATSSHNEVADPKKAIELTKSFNRKIFRDEATLYEIKAAAFAAMGDFEEAIEQQEEALDEAEDMGADLTNIKQNLAMYKSKKLWF